MSASDRPPAALSSRAIVQRNNRPSFKWLHQTRRMCWGSTAAARAAMVAWKSTQRVRTGDKVLCGATAKFGERWVKVDQGLRARRWR